MTKLTLWDDLPTTTDSEITKQILSSNMTKIVDLGDVIGFLKSNMPEDDFETLWTGVEQLLSVLTESFDGNRCKVKMIISHSK